MAFLDDAKEFLGDKFDRLQLLAKKSADFESTPDEEKELAELKAGVRSYIAQRDRAKNLAFIKESGFTVAEVLQSMNATKDQINAAIKQLFPAEFGPVLGTITTHDEEKKVDVVEEIRQGKALSRAAMKALKGNEKAFVKCLTPEGKALLMVSHKATVGRAIGQDVYSNMNPVLSRFKLDKEKLLKELKSQK